MNARRRALGSSLASLLAPVALLLVVGFASVAFGRGIQLQVQTALVVTAMVVALHVFAGNSGVISFGHISFVAIGAFAAGIFSMATKQKQTVFKDLFGVIKDHHLGNLATIALGTVLGCVFALVVGAAVVRLNGLAAGIATFAVLGITRNVLRNWTKVGPGAKAIPSIDETTDLAQALIAVIAAVVVAWLYQRSSSGRRLRATREDLDAAQGIGINVYRERLIAVALSGAIGGFAGAVYVHLLGSVTTDQVYLKLTFLTLAMLVIGGIGSLWGAVVGGLAISLVNSLLFEAEKGLSLFGPKLTLPTGTSDIVLAALMAVMLLLRPTGLSRGREVQLPSLPM
jgi:branched-chain amino acid transport system permease protein